MHIICIERWLQSDHLVYDAAQRPYIALEVVGLILPDLGTGVIRCARLGIVKTVLVGKLGNVHIADFTCAIFVHENVGRFDVPVHDVVVVEGFETAEHLDEHMPDVTLREPLHALLALADLLEQVTVVRVLHHDAERIELRIHEDLFVGDYVRVLDACQNAHFIDRISSLSLVQLRYLHLFQCVRPIVSLASHVVHTGVCALAQLLDHLKVSKGGWGGSYYDRLITTRLSGGR